MQLTGEQLIGYQVIRGKGRELLAINPDDQQAISTPVFTCATADLVDQTCVLAEQAFDPFRATDPETRAQFLEAIADGIVELGSTLTERAHIETGLPMARLEGERGRTAGQLRLFASVLRQGRWQTATLDSALPERQREAIVLQYYQELSNIDAAALMNISVEALESLLSRARRQLRSSLADTPGLARPGRGKT